MEDRGTIEDKAMKCEEGIRSHKRKTMEVNTNKEIKQHSNHKYSNTGINKVLELRYL